MAEGDRIKARAAEVLATGEPANRLAGHPELLAAIWRAPREAWQALLEHTLTTSPTLQELRQKVAEYLPEKDPVEPQSRRRKAAKEDGDEEENDDVEEEVDEDPDVKE